MEGTPDTISFNLFGSARSFQVYWGLEEGPPSSRSPVSILVVAMRAHEQCEGTDVPDGDMSKV